MIVLFTDFGMEGPYIGQMKSVILRHAPDCPIVDLFSNAPVHDPKASAYLLAAYLQDFPPGSVFVCVVDPGVGGDRKPVAVQIDGQWFVGPDNGLFNVVAVRGQQVQWWEIIWRPDRLSASFHGRDVFAPVAAQLARGTLPGGVLRETSRQIGQDWGHDYASIIYIDHFGNAMTGIRGTSVKKDKPLCVNNQSLSYARTFSETAIGEAFWYENANGLIEIAVNQGRASEYLRIKTGDRIEWG